MKPEPAAELDRPKPPCSVTSTATTALPILVRTEWTSNAPVAMADAVTTAALGVASWSVSCTTPTETMAAMSAPDTPPTIAARAGRRRWGGGGGGGSGDGG